MRIIIMIQLFCFTGVGVKGWSQNINIKVVGSTEQGFSVDIYNGNQLLIHNTEEFKLKVANLDLSEITEINNWKGSEWTGDETIVKLSKETYLPDFDLNLSITVTYEVVNSNVVKKRVDLFQSGMPSLYYTIEENFKPSETPSKYITFEHDNFPGGFVHEMFPSAGFVTPHNQLVGFLMDAGYKNHYTRTTRRRFNGHGGGFVGMRKLPDAELVSVATIEERVKGQHYIQQKFGENYNLDAGKDVALKISDNFIKVGAVEIKEQPRLITLNCKPSNRSGLEIIAPFKNQKVYTISFLLKGNSPMALKLFRIKNGKKTIELEHGIKYIDQFPISENEWTLFKGSILIPYIEKDSVSMFIGTQSGNEAKIEIKDLKIIEHQPQREPYNRMNMGEMVTKTSYVFVEPWTNHHDFVISSQSRFAEGKGFKGSLIEKMLYANFNMLTWITSINDFTPLNVPNMNYAPDMYNRDSFFSIVSSYNEELNLKIWEQWSKTQNSKGAVATIITPYMGTIEAKDNEATIQFLIWAMMNKRRFGVTLPKEKIDKAVEYVLNEFDEDRNGICESHFTLSQVDINVYEPKTDKLAVNQGMFAIALKTIKELGYNISDSYIKKAELGYLDFYDLQRKHLLFDRDFPDVITMTDLEPEFFSLWLFNKPMLTDDMVINHLNQIPILNKVPNSPHPEYGTTAPVCVRLDKSEKGYSYLTSDYQPFREFGEVNYKDGARDGFYYNGGSWMRPEYCGYVVGLRHGWHKAKALMENRAWAEINLNPKWPYSKEFIPTKWTTTDSWWESTRGLCWNVFILMANEVAGIREPAMDPDFKK
ncbi:hypothetical protein QLS71_004055 [Mariniflexile litorale]|uniref:Uncharacterized protein n=1 Tax=Mariniflexile litorale TaxID=3045158 RepID=A0AAU7EI36_9FLAO|nr:hypothetical protein [Mariniflexile sp. KMM 9835]MDQ8210194.1 hypothetical protein [Mariniflexile sp. KMM 9835]